MTVGLNILDALESPFERLVRGRHAIETQMEGAAIEVDPDTVGMTGDGVEAIWNAVLKFYGAGINPAIALCIRRRGEVIVDRAVGYLDESDALVSATPSSLYNLFSASKMVVAMLVHLLAERGDLSLDDAVVQFIPEFSPHGKSSITLRHVLCHRAGLPGLSEPTTLELINDKPRLLELLCAAEPKWRPGGPLAYHALTGGYILEEVLRRVTGRSLNELVKSEFSDPMGLPHFRYGVEPVDVPRVARHSATGLPMPKVLLDRVHGALGIDFARGIELSNDSRFLTAVAPSANLITTPNQACAFMDMLRTGGRFGEREIFKPRTVQYATAEHAFLIDKTFAFPMRYGLGFMLGSRYPNFFGPRSELSFGHLGFTNVLIWSDPVREISGAFMTTGKSFLSPRLYHFWAVMRTIAERCSAGEN